MQRIVCAELILRHMECDPEGFFDNLITMDESWVYCYDPEPKGKSSQWLPIGAARPQKALRAWSTVKSMLVSFFDKCGLVYHEFVRHPETVDRHVFVQILHRMRLSLRRRCPRMFANNRILLHMDNAPVHHADLIHIFMDRTNITQVPHPPYSPDLAPSDFWFFPTLKRTLKGRRFNGLDDLESEVDYQIGLIPGHAFRNCIMNIWPRRLQRAIDVDGGFFEGQPHT